tara:strand:+ start:281 stop:775 length:495 start_codon:yes stop_codon:yes gene_type:complete
MAAAMWKAEAVGSGAPFSVAKARTPEAFAQTDAGTIAKWMKFARAALSALPPQEVKALVWVDKGTYFEADNPLGGITLQAANREQAADREAIYIARVQNALVYKPPQEVSVQEAIKVADERADRYAMKAATYHGGSNLCAHYTTLSKVSRGIADDIRALSEKPQ